MGHWSQFELSKRFYHETIKLKRVVQIGNQGNSSPAWKKVADLVRQGAIGRPQLVEAAFCRQGDWGERMHIPDPEAKPGPDLDWEAFLGDAPKSAVHGGSVFQLAEVPAITPGDLCTDLFPHVFTPFVNVLGVKIPSLRRRFGRHFQIHQLRPGGARTHSTCASIIRRSFQWSSSEPLPTPTLPNQPSAATRARSRSKTRASGMPGSTA